jgi:HEPN domain-containing protein
VAGQALAPMSDPFTAHDWQSLALDELAAARTLAQARHWQPAYQHAGMAVECALKCAIMRKRGLNAWPDRSSARKLHVHDLRRLLLEAGLERQMLHEIAMVSPLGQAWAIAQDWRNEARYERRPFPEALARDMVWAAEEGGLVAWLISP